MTFGTLADFIYSSADLLTFLQLFYSFFKTGFFSVGGGMATLPFLFEMATEYEWMSADIIPDMIAISEATPGSLGINMATYAGFTSAGFAGALIATAGLILPSMIVIILIIRCVPDFFERKQVKDIMYILRPTVLALVAAVGCNVFSVSVFQEGFPAFSEAFLRTVSSFSGNAAETGIAGALSDAAVSISPFVSILQIIVFFVLLYTMHKKGGSMIYYILAAAVLGIVLKL